MLSSNNEGSPITQAGQTIELKQIKSAILSDSHINTGTIVALQGCEGFTGNFLCFLCSFFVQFSRTNIFNSSA